MDELLKKRESDDEGKCLVQKDAYRSIWRRNGQWSDTCDPEGVALLDEMYVHRRGDATMQANMFDPIRVARRYWDMSLVRGVVAIIFGLLAIFWPHLTFTLFM